MILERVEKDELVKAIYESSNVLASTYNRNDKNLNVVFKNGGNYTYQNVSETDYMRFETAESQGKVLNTQIKRYAFLKHDPVDTDDYLKKIKDLKESELKALIDGLIIEMEEAVAYSQTNGTFNDGSLDKITRMIELYNNTK